MVSSCDLHYKAGKKLTTDEGEDSGHDEGEDTDAPNDFNTAFDDKIDNDMKKRWDAGDHQGYQLADMRFQNVVKCQRHPNVDHNHQSEHPDLSVDRLSTFFLLRQFLFFADGGIAKLSAG